MKTTFFMILIAMFITICGNSANTNNLNKLWSDISDGKDTLISFENETTEGLPAGFSASATGKARSIKWSVVNDNGNKMAVQQAANEGSCYNLLVLDNIGYKDFTASVKIKAVSGEEDQGGGLVWRYIDRNNYYIARYNPLENNLRFYRVINGKREQLKSVDSPIKKGEWFTMTIKMDENKIMCSLNEEKLIETTDDTFQSAGLIGLWTKADAVTYFDDLEINDDK